MESLLLDPSSGELAAGNRQLAEILESDPDTRGNRPGLKDIYGDNSADSNISGLGRWSKERQTPRGRDHHHQKSREQSSATSAAKRQTACGFKQVGNNQRLLEGSRAISKIPFEMTGDVALDRVYLVTPLGV